MLLRRPQPEARGSFQGSVAKRVADDGERGRRDGRRISNQHTRETILELILVGWNSLNVHRVRIPSDRCSRSKQMDHAKSGSKSMKPFQRTSF